MLQEMNQTTFESEVLGETQKPVLVDFWAPWCGPCRMLTPVLERFSEQHSDFVKVVKVNTDENEALARQYSVMSIPTLIVFQNGKPAHKVVGVQSIDALKKLCGV